MGIGHGYREWASGTGTGYGHRARVPGIGQHVLKKSSKHSQEWYLIIDFEKIMSLVIFIIFLYYYFSSYKHLKVDKIKMKMREKTN